MFRLRFPNLPRRHICLTGVGEGNTTTFKRSEERGRTATNQSSCYAADARWDGGTANRPTDTSTGHWRRGERFGHMSQARARQKCRRESLNS
ncbi:hypothetical protein TIFTF001_029105 [Ficus carica]|uniref:Uncharacterized protein n=1 Tax=Ficus carica TaxID=3494 RepID=A0AA88J201_FICCA|nr:hypothetical protein TIFTF001_029105 [Ficus carica]